MACSNGDSSVFRSALRYSARARVWARVRARVRVKVDFDLYIRWTKRQGMIHRV
jgi:hypothetical protein